MDGMDLEWDKVVLISVNSILDSLTRRDKEEGSTQT